MACKTIGHDGQITLSSSAHQPTCVDDTGAINPPARKLPATLAWTVSGLGASSDWSSSLRTVAHIVMDAPLPMFLIWGATRTLIYNAGFAELADTRHPEAFGRPVADVWPELWRWDENVFETEYRGAVVSFQDQHLVRTDTERCFDLFYTPVRDDDGRVRGVLCNVVDTTRRALAEQAAETQTKEVEQLADTLDSERRSADAITSRLQAESDSLKALFEQAPGFMALTRGPDHVFEQANRSYLKLAGERNLLGQRVSDAFPEVVSQGFIDLLDKVYHSGEPYLGKNVEVYLSNKVDQPPELRLLDFVYQPVRDGGGCVTGIFVEGIDITDRAAAEERLRVAHEAGGIGTFEWFPATGEMITSETYRALWGLANETDIRAETLVALVNEEDRHQLGTAAEQNCENPLAYAEFRIRRPDTGEQRWLARRGEVLGDGVHAVRRYVGVAFDITERKQVEEALASTERKVNESTEFIRLLLDSTEEGFYSISRDSAITLCNRGFLRMLGFSHETDVLGNKLHDLFQHSQDDGTPYPKELCPIYLTAQTGEAAHVEHAWFHRTDGSRFPVEYRVHPIWRNGELQGALCTFNDITQRMDSIDQLRVLNETLEHRVIEEIDRRARAEEALHQSQKMEAIGQLTGGVAHDFNNVLHIIGGNLQLLQGHVNGNAIALRRLETASAAVQRGAKLSSQLLAFARRQPLQPIVTHLGRLVQNMNDLLRRALGESIQVETTIAPDLWNTLADPSQIENVILNLAINSRDAMEAQGRIVIKLGNVRFKPAALVTGAEPMPAGEYVLLTVSDNGVGMSPDILKKAFDPFFTTKPEGEGTGLGLSMAYGFVKQSHGHIKIDSQPGVGTTIRIYLPRSLEAEARIAVAPKGPVEGGNETILVVEDDPGVQATVVDILTMLGYRVLKAGDGESALSILLSGVQIDLLFTDVVMPGRLRSPELARQARLVQPQLAVLFTSGYTQDAIVHGGRLDPGVDLLSKPYRRDQLARKIRASLLNARSAESLQAPVRTLAAQAVPALAVQPAPQPVAKTPEGSTGEELVDPSTPDIAAPDTAAPAGRLRVLVVEDNPDLCILVCELLDTFGHTVDSASTGEQALEKAQAHAFDVLLTDVRLPGMSGVELARRIHADMPAVHIIFASGYGTSVSTNIGFESHSLAKPYDIEQLQQLLLSLTR